MPSTSLEMPDGLQRILGAVKGHKEYEAKILRVDSAAVRERLQRAGAVKKGTFDIVEQRYFPSEPMMQFGLSVRLRKLTEETVVRVEHVLKLKHKSLTVPGHEAWGKVLKHRTEFEVALLNTTGDECCYQLMHAMLLLTGLKARDVIETSREQYAHDGCTFELEKIRSYTDERGQRHTELPAEFLEIEVPAPAKMAEAVQVVGHAVWDLTALTKRDLC